MEGKLYTPLPPPDKHYSGNPQPPLTDKERGIYDEVYNHFALSAGYTLPGAEKGELTEDEQFWLSYECILRYLRATKWKAPAAILRLEATLKWRREFGFDKVLTADHIEPEAVTGKQVLFGHDTKGRPALYMIPSRQNTTEPTRQIQHAVWMLERCIDLMAPGVESLDILINFGDRAKNPSMSTSRTVLNILQDHYPERLGLSLVINVPFLVNAFFKLILPFVDPITREKIKFNPQVLQEDIFTANNLMSEWWGGACDFEYQHDKYWPELVKLSEDRVRTWKERWTELGGTVGIREWDYKRPKKEEVELENVGVELGEDAEVEGGDEGGAVGGTTNGDDESKGCKDKGEPNGIHVDTHNTTLNSTAIQGTPSRTHSPWVVVDGTGTSGNDCGGGSGGGGGGGGNSGGDSGGGDSGGGGGDGGGGGGD